MKDNMIFSVKQYNNHDSQFGNLDMTISLPYDAKLENVLEVFERMALALTFSPGSLKVAYENRLEEVNDTLRALAEQVEPEPGYDEDLLETEDYAEWVNRISTKEEKYRAY